jgi:hypothetical protein
MFVEPLAGWREVAVRKTKTKVDWAIEVASLIEGRYADTERVVVVCNILNTHMKGAFYEAFAPTRARQLIRRIEFCYMPSHRDLEPIPPLPSSGRPSPRQPRHESQ